MKLLIVSHTPHYKRGSQILGWGPTIREINYLAQLFDEVVHLAPLHTGEAPESALPYASCVRLHAVSPVGGDSFIKKVATFIQYPSYAIAFWKELVQADVLHIRSPASISLLAICLMVGRSKPQKRWYKYAGNWQHYPGEPWSYRLQRWLLARRIGRGWVTVNGQWPRQPQHIISMLNPGLTDSELEQGVVLGRPKALAEPVQLLFVGGLYKAKGVDKALEILHQLYQKGIQARLDIVGDGPEKERLVVLAQTLGILDLVSFHGWMRRTDIAPFYSQAHILLLPSKTEGWPKVLSEAMAYGVIPVASRVGSIPQYTEDIGIGKSVNVSDLTGFVEAIITYTQQPMIWKEESMRAITHAAQFGYSAYLARVAQLLDIPLRYKTSVERV